MGDGEDNYKNKKTIYSKKLSFVSENFHIKLIKTIVTLHKIKKKHARFQ